MFIPLERLYHFVDSAIAISYRHELYVFHPPGDKDLLNVINLKHDQIPNFPELLLRIPVICHDQEPLDFSLYVDTSPFVKQIKEKENYKHQSPHQNLKYCHPWHFFEKFVLLHSEKNSAQETIYKQNGFAPAFWWSHAMIARDWFRYAKIDPTLQPATAKRKKFLIYNRAWSGTREYRLKFVEMLLSNNLHHHCKMSFQPVCQNINYKDYVFKNQNFEISKQSSFEKYFDCNKFSSEASAVYDAQDINETWLSVVLETVFDDSCIHLTEKVLRPIACGHPFILCAGPGSLAFLKSYGFKTFSPWIDERYDDETDAIKRLQMILEEMHRLSSLSNDEITNLQSHFDDITRFNKQVFFSDQFADQVISELVTNSRAAIIEAHASQNIDRMSSWFDWAKSRNKGKPEMLNKIGSWISGFNQLLEKDQSHYHSLDDKSSTDGHDV